MGRKPLVAGNWKMHGSREQVKSLIQGIVQGLTPEQAIEIVVLPAFVYLNQVKQMIDAASIELGAQNLYLGAQGAFTGEVSGPMLADLGCRYVLVGHSERRSVFHEDNELVAFKFKAAQDAGLTPILCIGETKEERQKNQTEAVITQQLQAVIDFVSVEAFRNAVIAYEPVWAIGTGLTASPAQAQEAHAFIRQSFSQNNVDIGRTIRILYGGSMKADNAAALLAMPDIDGGLIGGASLNAESFLAICQAAQQKVLQLDKRQSA